MTRLTLGLFKNAARNPSARARDTGDGFPTPMSTANAAVRLHHQRGVAAAHIYLNGSFDRSGYWGPSGPPQARSWANNIRECFQTYQEMAGEDRRPTLGMPIKTDIQFGANSVGITVDVVLMDSEGYVGRYPLWDVPSLTRDDAELLACPIALGMGQELGRDRIVGVDLWHLRDAETIFVPAASAIARANDVAEILARYLSD
jgi:hypothetical protein